MQASIARPHLAIVPILSIIFIPYYQNYKLLQILNKMIFRDYTTLVFNILRLIVSIFSARLSARKLSLFVSPVILE